MEKHKKREEKLQRRQDRKTNPSEADPNAYLEYLNPAGVAVEPEAGGEESGEDSDGDDGR